MLSWDLETKYRSLGYEIICGTDEAGRGPLAGPVAGAACILPSDFNIDGLDDSKKLSPKKRDLLYEFITAHALSYAVAYASVEEIEEINILNAALLAMERAVRMLNPQPSLILADGNITRGFTKDAVSVIGGDALSPSIAAASVLAKVSRDRLCAELDTQYPGYGIAKHKGYGTAFHYEMLKKLGPSPCHRKSFLKNLHKK
ncbi:MAG: ribonuclease HII [Eubacteriales bacterium]|nr:ribonuclease HII [Eubacteriales bacterium]